MAGIPGIGDGPEGPTMDAPTGVAGPRFDQAPERPVGGTSTFLVVKTPNCVWCQKTLDFLEALHQQRGDFQVVVLDANEHPEAFQQVTRHTRRTTVPQVFLDGSLVGGWNELAAAAKRGQIDAYLEGADWRAPQEGQARRRWWRKGADVRPAAD